MSSAESELKAINGKLGIIEGNLKTIANLLGGSEYGEDGIIEKQNQNRKEIAEIKEEISTLKRIRVEIALISGFIGASLKTCIDWIIKSNDYNQED